VIVIKVTFISGNMRDLSTHRKTQKHLIYLKSVCEEKCMKNHNTDELQKKLVEIVGLLCLHYEKLNEEDKMKLKCSLNKYSKQISRSNRNFL
jgi:hypothetical protein